MSVRNQGLHFLTASLRRKFSAPLCLIWLAAAPARGAWPDFAADQAMDAWLREGSAWYRSMAGELDRRGGYVFQETDQAPAGAAIYDKGRRYIALNPAVHGPERTAIAIFELTNHYQEQKFFGIDWDVYHGRITSPGQYALVWEVVEYDGLRLQKRVLRELERAFGPLPQELIRTQGSAVSTDAGDLPLAYDCLKNARALGHQKTYRERFLQYRAEMKTPRAE